MFRTAVRLLLLLVALALASAAGEPRTAPGQDTIVAAAPTAATIAFEARDGPRPPGSLSVVRPPGLPAIGRAAEGGPPTGGLCPSFRSADLPALAPSHGPTRLRALARSRLEFAHASAIARSGALSSFSTSLPPPLAA